MRVGIYNRWLSTLGGGERHSLAIAEYLSQAHEVFVINHENVDKEFAGNRLSLDLSKINILKIPDRPATELTPITEEYDFFINAAYMDYFPSNAPKSATLIYFPTPLDMEYAIRRSRRIKLALRRWLKVPSYVSGAYSIDIKQREFTRYLENEALIRLPFHKRPYTVEFNLRSVENLIDQATIYLDSEEISIIKFQNNDNLTCRIEVPASDNLMFHELIIKSKDMVTTPDQSPVRMALTRFRINLPVTYIYYLFFENLFKDLGRRLHFIPPATFSVLESLKTYNMIWANSVYTSGWIKKYWGLHSEVLYPPIDIPNIQPKKKKKQILSVGRFFYGGHNKKHLVMIDAFRQMVDEGLSNWELHLAGGTAPEAIHQEYLQCVKREAEGYPIFVHTDVDRDCLANLYGESALYWHASGFGEDENRDPIKFEHFGITTVEAMAFECVPVVIAKGGQTEIVSHGENGFLWSSLDELKRFSIQLIGDSSITQQMAKKAVTDSHRYDKIHFAATLKDQLQKINVL